MHQRKQRGLKLTLRDGKVSIFYPRCGCWCRCGWQSSFSNLLTRRGAGKASVCTPCLKHAKWGVVERKAFTLAEAEHIGQKSLVAFVRAREQKQAPKRVKHAIHVKVHRDSLRSRVLDHYGRKCACCAETQPLLLTLSGVNDGYRLYERVIREGFPDSFQVLCWSCNAGKQRNNGTCPHITVDKDPPLC